MSYKNYLAISKASAEKFEGFDNNNTNNKIGAFNDTGVPYAEFVVSKGRNVAKPIHTFNPTAEVPTDVGAIKDFQDRFLTANNNEFTDYPTKEIGNYYSADIINVVRRMLNPTENLFTIPVPADMKDKFTQIFSNRIVGTPKKYATVNQFRFELDFDENPSYEQVLQLRTFMTLMESEYSTQTGTEVTTGLITADDIAREFGPDMATLYDFSLEYTEKTFDSKVPLSAEMPEVSGPVISAYLHAKQAVALDQPLNADGFFTRAMDGRNIQYNFLAVRNGYDNIPLTENKTVLEKIQMDKAILKYDGFEKALGLNGKTEPMAWENEGGFFAASLTALTDEEEGDIQQVLTDFNKAIYVTFSWPITNGSGVEVARGTATGIFEPFSHYKKATGMLAISKPLEADASANARIAAIITDAQTIFDQYLKARGY